LKKIIAVIAGGKLRQDSVWNGLQALPPDTDIVLVHDGARPFAEPALISSLIRSLKNLDGVVPALAPKDTIKEVDKDGIICQTLDRGSLMAVQTPQVFHYEVICKAYEMAMRAGYYATDDAALVEAAGGRVKCVPGSPRNIKITTREDIITAEGFCK
jgi:2-C-methyl-D-erythritol 4-phosphate cytidylyltransferase